MMEVTEQMVSGRAFRAKHTQGGDLWVQPTEDWETEDGTQDGVLVFAIDNDGELSVFFFYPVGSCIRYAE